MEDISNALPQNIEQLITALVSIVVTLVLSFLRGRKVGHDRAIEGKD